MDLLKSALVTIFKEQNPYKILRNQFEVVLGKENNYQKLNKNTFIDLCMQLEKQCSRDEVENYYEIVKSNMKKTVQDSSYGNNIFNLLLNYSEKKLEYCGENVKCRYKELLKWRMATLKLDQDLFICSYLAYKDILIGKDRCYFDWDTIIKSNNRRIHNMLSQGIAENHFHLKGSAPTFKLSWISLMNDIKCKDIMEVDIEDEENRLEKDLSGKINLKDSIVIAAVIRVFLFKLIMYKSDFIKDEQEGIQLLSILKEFAYAEDAEVERLASLYSSQIQSEINALKHIYGVNIRYLNMDVKVDYALTKDINRDDKTTRLFLGERAFMYKCFKLIYKNDKKFLKYADLFYTYIIIKNKIRSELIQTNERVGFANFSQYQGRKTKYLRKGTVLYDFVEPGAILTSIKNQNMVSIEARVIPAKTAEENVKQIKKMDKLICNQIFNDRHNKWFDIDKDKNFDEIKYGELSITECEILLDKRINEKIAEFKDKFFYVFHFPKSKDKQEKLSKDDIMFMSRCRHYSIRKDLKEYAYAIYSIRENNPKEACRVLGIDACSNELYTRPEVYGQTFRFLKGHLPSSGYQRHFNRGYVVPKLYATYHVGEDFLDCADGLRAIDEAIYFLDLTHGDRLGHAIALGIDVFEWYEKKNYKVYLSKQDILDNVAWLIMKMKEFNIEGASETIHKLTTLYNKYYTDIYITGDSSEFNQGTNSTVIPVDNYMSAWKLRGDNPEIYKKIGIETNSMGYWDRCERRERDNADISKTVIELYTRYHYDSKVKEKGYKRELLKVEMYMIQAINSVQKCMQEEICKRGIAIECNPSSNVLISNFARYDKHPIINMYNLGLTIDENKAAQFAQMFVSINTDDQGVFDTLLENEFALMGIALEKAKDENGKPLYNQAMIYDWLDRIRKMGIEQSFKYLD